MNTVATPPRPRHRVLVVASPDDYRAEDFRAMLAEHGDAEARCPADATEVIVFGQAVVADFATTAPAVHLNTLTCPVTMIGGKPW